MSREFRKVQINIVGSSEAGDTRLDTVGTIAETEEGTVIRYYEKFDGDSVVTKNLLTIKGQGVTLEKSGGVRATLKFSHGTVNETVYRTAAGPLSMQIISDNVFTKLHEEGADVELDYRIRFAPDSEAKNSLKLVARYIEE